MKLVDLPLYCLRPAPWNANTLTPEMEAKLKASISHFGIAVALVVRPLGERYEVLSGNQRLKALVDLGYTQAPCLLSNLDDAQARLLSQALNHLHGQDNPGLRAELLRTALAALPEADVLALLPETADSLKELVSLGQQDMAHYLRAFQEAQATRLKHLQFQLLQEQLPIVERALRKALPQAKEAKGDSPNLRGTALTVICQHYQHCRRGCS